MSTTLIGSKPKDIRGVKNNLKMKKREEYRKYIYMGIVVISLGIVFSTTLKDNVEPLGNVLVAVGGLLFIVGMSKKKKEEKERDNN